MGALGSSAPIARRRIWNMRHCCKRALIPREISTVPFWTRNGTVEPVVGRAREEEHVEIIKPEMTLQTIAEARLAQLMKEKIVTGLGFGRRGNEEIVFVVIDTQAAGPNGS